MSVVSAMIIWVYPLQFDTPAAGETLRVVATISDGLPEHDVVLPITLEFVAVDKTIIDRTSGGDSEQHR